MIRQRRRESIEQKRLGGLNRRGASLTEVIVVISIASSLIGMVGVVFHRLFQCEQTATRSALIELSTSRLADQFRRDVHAAESMQRRIGEDDGQPILELKTQQESPRIVYVSNKHMIERTLVSGEQILSRESYRIPGCKVTFPESSRQTIDTAESLNGQLVTLRLERPHSLLSSAPQVSIPLHPLIIEAELSRDHRLVRGKPSVATQELREVTP